MRGMMSQVNSIGSEPSLLEMPTPPVLPAEDTPTVRLKPRQKPEPAWKRYDHLIHDGPAYFEALRKDRLAHARAERQQKVRQAALALFAARGVAATSLARIAWHMEISPASLRRAYPDKPALLAGILEAHIGALLEAVGTAKEEAEAAAFAPRAKLSAMAAAALQYLAGEGALALRIFPQAEALLEPASRSALAEKRRWLVALFASSIEESLPDLGARGGEPPARALLALLEAAACWSDAERGSEDLSAYAARAVAGILAMANPPPEDGSRKRRNTEASPETAPRAPCRLQPLREQRGMADWGNPKPPAFQRSGTVDLAQCVRAPSGLRSGFGQSPCAEKQKMADEKDVLDAVRRALHSEARIRPTQGPIRLSFTDGALTMEGEVADIAGKKLALEAAAKVPGVRVIIDRLHVRPATPMGDGEIRDQVRDALLEETALADCTIRVFVKGELETVREPANPTGTIDIKVEDGIVTLDGDVAGWGQKRLASVLARHPPGKHAGAALFPPSCHIAVQCDNSVFNLDIDGAGGVRGLAHRFELVFDKDANGAVGKRGLF